MNIYKMYEVTKKNIYNHWHLLTLLLIFVFFIFLRFYLLEAKSSFGWDQVDNAWAAKNIIVDKKLPLVGMQAKGSSGFFIGPYYYYLLVPVYFLTNLDPIASGIFAGITSVISFFIIYFITRSLFSNKIALLAVFFYTASNHMIIFDRVQWPVNFILPVSILIFFSLFKIITGNSKFFLLLAGAFGLSLHVHFTSVFYPILFVFCLPFIPRTKQAFKYFIFSIPIFLFFLIPQIIFSFVSNATTERNAMNYIGTYYHGFHLRRFFQLTADAFIEFEAILYFRILKYLGWLLIPIFSFLYLLHNKEKTKRIFVMLTVLWFIVPWIAFSTYKGEISDYYFSITIPLVLIIISYVIYNMLTYNFITKMVVGLFLLSYVFFNINSFWNTNNKGLDNIRKSVNAEIMAGQLIPFTQGDPQSYIYYIYNQRQSK